MGAIGGTPSCGAVFLKPSIAMDIDWISFFYVGQNHSRVAARDVGFFEEYQSWAEVKHVGEPNMALAILWARKQLNLPCLRLRDAVGNREALSRIRQVECIEQFVVLRLA